MILYLPGRRRFIGVAQPFTHLQQVGTLERARRVRRY